MEPMPDYNRLKRCRHGRMLYNINDVYIGRSLDLYGEYAEGEMQLLSQVLRPGDLAMDIGANIGTHTVVFARAVGPRGAVLAFEPQRLVYQTLCANVALNSLVNVWCFNAAVSDVPGSIPVPPLNPCCPNNFGGLGLRPGERGEPVPLMRLDSLAVPNCRLLKIDVEGMELQVLKGADAMIRRLRPALYVENDRADRSAELVRHIAALDYDLYWHCTALFNDRNFAGNPTNVFGDTISSNMLCLPREAQGNIAGLQRVEVPAD